MDLLLAFFVFMASMISAIVLDYSMIFALLAGLNNVLPELNLKYLL